MPTIPTTDTTEIGLRTFTIVLDDGAHTFSTGGECGDLRSPHILNLFII